MLTAWTPYFQVRDGRRLDREYCLDIIYTVQTIHHVLQGEHASHGHGISKSTLLKEVLFQILSGELSDVLKEKLKLDLELKSKIDQLYKAMKIEHSTAETNLG